MTKSEALKEVYKQWDMIARLGISFKSENGFAYNCACCEYVIQKEYGVNWRNNGVRLPAMCCAKTSLNNKTLKCVNSCPLKDLWPSGCEAYGSPYKRWLSGYDRSSYESNAQK